jgi:hypothetical protein
VTHNARRPQRVAVTMSANAITVQNIESDACTSVESSIACEANGTPAQ